MDPRACVERLLQAIAEDDAAEIVQASADLLTYLMSLEGMLATYVEREKIKLALAMVADHCENVRLGHPGPAACADCGSDNCCKQFAEGMES